MTGGALRQRPAPSGRTNTMSKPVKIMAILTALPGKTDALEALLKGMVAPSRAEPGNLRWDLWHDKSDPARFAIDELYRDNAAVAAHRETPHYRDDFAKINALAERIAGVLDPIAID
jgi:quinol monooxygenase YgiN